MIAQLVQTRLEERDGGTWVSGLCPFCWERHAFPAPARMPATVHCSEGHELQIAALHSEGEGSARVASQAARAAQK